MNTKLSNEFEWFTPYLKKVKNLVPVHQLEKIIAIKPRLDQVQHHHAQLVKHGSRKYISINLYYIKTKKLEPLKRKIEPFSKLDLLEYLAHELAHLKEWNHTPAHKKLEARLTGIFMTILENEGYKSEEYELKHERPQF